MPTVSIFLPFLATRAEQFVPYMALVQRSTAARLWTGQPLTFDVNQGFSFAAGLGLRAPVGTAVTLMPLRHPFEAAMQARALALTTGHPVVAGFGPGSADFQRAVMGEAYASPLTAAREYLTVLRGLLDGEKLAHDGRYVTLHGGQPASPHPPVELGLGVLRRRMAEVAGEVADVAITWLTPPGYIRDVLVPSLGKGAANTGRAVPRVVSVVHLALNAPGRDPADLVYRANSRHLQAPHYCDMLARAGVPVDPADPRAGARALVDAGVFVTGEPSDVAERIAAYADAGVDEVALHMHGASMTQPVSATLDELQLVLDAVARCPAGASRGGPGVPGK